MNCLFIEKKVISPQKNYLILCNAEVRLILYFSPILFHVSFQHIFALIFVELSAMIFQSTLIHLPDSSFILITNCDESHFK